MASQEATQMVREILARLNLKSLPPSDVYDNLFGMLTDLSATSWKQGIKDAENKRLIAVIRDRIVDQRRQGADG